jgi:hypothetical protein
MLNFWRKLMARPAIVRPSSGGEIILKNVDPELTKAIKALVEGVVAKPATIDTPYVPAMVAITEALASPVTENTHPMTKTAIGVFKDENEIYKFATVKFNPKSLQAKVEKVTNVGFEQAEAVEKFKIEAVKNNFVA